MDTMDSFILAYQSNNKEEWSFYLDAVTSKYVNDEYYLRFAKAALLVEHYQQNSFTIEGDFPEGRQGQMEYINAKHGLPEWFVPKNVLKEAEEILTAYCFVTYAAKEYNLERIKEYA